MRLFFIFFFTIGTCIVATATVNLQANNKADFSCTVTRTASSTVSGVDCDGNPFSVTSTKTASGTAETCGEADAIASATSLAAATSEARAYALSIIDCDAPDE